METIAIILKREEILSEVAKATDYTGTKLIDADAASRDRILAADSDLAELSRFWDEAILSACEDLKEMVISCADQNENCLITLEVSKSFDKARTQNVSSALQSFMIASIIGQWFKFANKNEAADYFAQAAEFLSAAERILYSRRKPKRPND